MRFGAIEIVSIAGDADGVLHAVRIRGAGKRKQVVAAASSAPGMLFADALSEVGRAVGVRRDRPLILAPWCAGGGVFQTETPVLSGNELRSALEFEVPRQLLRPPADFRIVCRVLSRTENAGKQQLLVWVADNEKLEPLWAALRTLKWKVDAVTNPFLALPPDFPADAALMLPGVEPDFFWRNGMFHPVTAGEMPDKAPLTRWIRNEFEFAGETGMRADAEPFYPALLTGAGFLRGEVDGSPVPGALRPRRLRTQLRTLAFLLTLLALLWGASAVRSVAGYYEEYTGIVNRTKAAQRRASELQRKLRSRDKEQKEMLRVLETASGSRDFLANLAELSAALPEDMLVSNLRINDASVDMTLQTSAENPDLGAALRKAPGFKVGTLQNRRVNDTLTMIELKLVRQEGGSSR